MGRDLTMMYHSNTTQFMFIIALGRHISILIESSSDPSKKQTPQRILNILKQGSVS